MNQGKNVRYSIYRPGIRTKFRVLACKTDETDLYTELWSDSRQAFAHAEHEKAPVFILQEHMYIRENRLLKSPLTAVLPNVCVQGNT